jgi:S1-C subfamily serine protease
MFARARAGAGRATGTLAPPRRRGRDLAVALGAGIAGALVTVGVLVAIGAFRTSSDTPVAAPTTVTAADDGARLAALAGPSVVAVVAATPGGPRRASGVCTSDGYVLTSAAAVGDAMQVTIQDGKGGMHGAEVLGRDDATGLVLLGTAGTGPGPRPARLAGSRTIRVGEWVVAVGRGDAAAPWAVTGVVASVGGWAEDGSGTRRAGLIATNMQIPPTAEGGALVDRSGHVVGILGGGAEGGTVATPIDTARAVAAELARVGTVRHGALGVRAADSASPRGAAVTEVLPDTAASRAGVQPGDILVRIDDTRVPDTATLVAEVAGRRPDEVVRLELRRGDDTVTLRVKLDAAATAGTTPGATPLSAGG